jgi:hypothetical protein
MKWHIHSIIIVNQGGVAATEQQQQHHHHHVFYFWKLCMRVDDPDGVVHGHGENIALGHNH